MSIEKTWGEINTGNDDDLSKLLHTPKLSKLISHNPLQKIKKNLLINMIWTILICMFYVVVIIYFKQWPIQLSIGIVLIFSIWALYTTYLQYKKIDTSVASACSLLSELKRHLASIANWAKTQQKVALFIYSVSLTGGFMMGGVLGSGGKSIETFMSQPFVWKSFIVCLIVLVPASHYLAKWMFNYAFGKHLNALKENIRALEEEK